MKDKAQAVVLAYNPGLEGQKQKYQELKGNLGYTVVSLKLASPTRHFASQQKQYFGG